MRPQFIAIFLVTLAACSAGNEGASVRPDMTGFTLWSNIPSEDIIVPDGVDYTTSTIEGMVVAQISGVPDAAPSTGTTGGVAIRMPPQVEAQASGARVQVTLRASAAEAGSVLGAAYSTAEVGNSGWQRFVLSAEPRDYVFGYDVRPMQAGNGDYLGLRSYGGSPVLIWGYKVEIIPAVAPSSPALQEPPELRTTAD